MSERVRRLPHVVSVSEPLAAGAISRDGTIAHATVMLDDTANNVPRAAIERLIDSAEEARGDGLQVELGGDAVRYVDAGGGGAESIGTLAALVILVFLFDRCSPPASRS